MLVASFLTRKVIDHWSDAYLDDPDTHERMPVVAVVLEEAQRVLSAGKDRESNVFPRVAREGRKFKVGLCAITQQPKLLDDELLSQFNTFFVLGLADEKDRNILRARPSRTSARSAPRSRRSCPASAWSSTSTRRSRCRPRSTSTTTSCAPPTRRPRRARSPPPNVAALVD